MLLTVEANQNTAFDKRIISKQKHKRAKPFGWTWAFNIEGIPNYKMPSADEVLEDLVEFHLDSDDSDDDVYDNNEDDEFEAEGHTTQ